MIKTEKKKLISLLFLIGLLALSGCTQINDNQKELNGTKILYENNYQDIRMKNMTDKENEYHIFFSSTGYSDFLAPYNFTTYYDYDCRDVNNYTWMYPTDYDKIFNYAFEECNKTYPEIMNYTYIKSNNIISNISLGINNKTPNGLIIVQGDEEIWRITYDGMFVWKGEVIENVSDIVDRIRSFFMIGEEGESFCKVYS